MRFLFVSFFNPDNIGIRCLAALLKEYGHYVHILQVKKLAKGELPFPPADIGWYVYYQGNVQTDFLIPSISAHECRLITKAISQFNPDVLCYSGMSTLDTQFPTFASIMKDAAPAALFVSGGPGPTLAPEHYLKNGSDIVIRGEGEESIRELAGCLVMKKDWKHIHNICYLHNDKLICNNIAPLEKNLDTYPSPLLPDSHFSFIDDEQYIPNKCLRQDGIYLIMGSRGCVGKCSYCSAPRMRKLYDGICSSYIRKRSIDAILYEANYAKNIGAYGILFADDFFVRPIDELISFFDSYKNNIGLHFSMYLHPQQLLDNDALLDAAINAGIRSFAFGLQHASRHVCEDIFNRKQFCSDYKLLVNKILQRGIPVNFDLIEGIPFETDADFEENIQFIAQFPYDPSMKSSVNFHIMLLNYISGSSLVEDNPGIEDIPRDTKDWFYKCLILNIRQMTDDFEFEKIYKNTYFKIHVNELRTLRNSIENALHLRHLEEQSARLKGREVFFWGDQKIFEERKHIFHALKPRDTLVGETSILFKRSKKHFISPTAILENPDLPVVAFVERRSIMRFLREWRHEYPNVNDLTICTENLQL